MNVDAAWGSWDQTLRYDGTDLRAEAVLAELLLTSGLVLDDFIQWPNGGFGRAVGRDIQRLHPPGALPWANNIAVVELNRPSSYDLLPEGLFHQVHRTRPFIGSGEVVEEIRHNNEIEEAARNLFKPTDSELLRTRVLVELNERRLTADLLQDRTGRGVRGFWEPPSSFEGHELGRLLMTLPHCHRITGDLPAMARAIGEILNIPIRINHRFTYESEVPTKDASSLDDARLGVDTILIGPIINVERIMKVIVGPIDQELADDFGPGQPGAQKVQHLMDHFAAADQLWELEVDVSATNASCRLEGDGVSRRLGVSSILN